MNEIEGTRPNSCSQAFARCNQEVKTSRMVFKYFSSGWILMVPKHSLLEYFTLTFTRHKSSKFEGSGPPFKIGKQYERGWMASSISRYLWANANVDIAGWNRNRRPFSNTGNAGLFTFESLHNVSKKQLLHKITNQRHGWIMMMTINVGKTSDFLSECGRPRPRLWARPLVRFRLFSLCLPPSDGPTNSPSPSSRSPSSSVHWYLAQALEL